MTRRPLFVVELTKPVSEMSDEELDDLVDALYEQMLTRLDESESSKEPPTRPANP